MKKKEKETWTDPKDFGLPFVEVKKLKDLEGNISSNPDDSSKESEENEVSATEQHSMAITQIPPSPNQKVEPSDELTESSEFKQVEENKEPKSEEKKTIPAKSPELPVRKSSSWVMVAAFIGLLLISTIVWQLMKEENSSPAPNNEASSETVAESTISSAIESEIIPNETQDDQTSDVDNQDSTGLYSNNPKATISVVESGTTIDDNEAGSLSRINSRDEIPTYYIIVASIRNEGLALKKSNEYRSRGLDVYMIAPYKGSANYRLAIGKFKSYTRAKNRLEEIKDDYSEALWILNY